MSSHPENQDWLDLLRSSAAVAVVFLHVAAEPVVFVPDRDSLVWHAANIIDSLSRWCIGVFVMVSGALLLDPARSEPAAEFYAKRMRRILLPLLFWSAGYIGLGIFMGNRVTLREVGLMFWEGRTAYHLWYLFMIIGLYAVTPILRHLLERSSDSARWIAVVVSFGLAAMWNLLLAIEERALPAAVPIMFLPYLGYYLAGRQLQQRAPIRLSTTFLAGVFAVASSITVLGTYALVGAYGISRRGLYFYDYLSPNVIAASIAVFCLAAKGTPACRSHPPRRHWLDRVSRKVRELGVRMGPLTLGVYLVHPMVIEAIRAMGYSASGTGSALGVPAIAVPTLVVSLVLTKALSEIPLLRRSVGFS